jgi:heme/copper-type cytochrome/quinol oxidase subunit 3
MADHLAPRTTQQAYPGRAAWRTFVEVLVAMPTVLLILSGLLALIAQDAFSQYLPPSWVAWLLAASVFTAALAALLARILAHPPIDAWLKRFHLSSSPRV